jgi:hypothetical protein
MARNPFMITFDPANDAHRDLPHWRSWDGKSAWANAKAYARAHGEALVFQANGHVLRYWDDEGSLRQRTYNRVEYIRYDREPTGPQRAAPQGGARP